MLANTGVVLVPYLFENSSSRSVIVSVVAARIVGKMAGITIAAAIVVRVGIARLPEEITWAHMAGAATLCGMGITVPLLFATAAFKGYPRLVSAAQIGLLLGTVIAFAIGSTVVVWQSRRSRAD
jgi:NhaA family Na+:H+ antiporter